MHIWQNFKSKQVGDNINEHDYAVDIPHIDKIIPDCSNHIVQTPWTCYQLHAYT